MLVKTGIDLVQVSRIKHVLNRFGYRFCSRILHSIELELFNKLKLKQEFFLAKRFAMKEAVSKAFGVGICKELSFQDICVTNDLRGAPEVNIAKEKLLHLSQNRVCNISVSVSDDCNSVVACAVVCLL
jgi:holo-[acyl-carrier protein] synthase